MNHYELGQLRPVPSSSSTRVRVASESSIAVIHVPSSVGHFLGYAQCFVEAARQHYSSVYLLVPESESRDSFSSQLESGVELLTYKSGLPDASWAPQDYRKLASWLGVSRACDALSKKLLQPVHLILTFIDMFPMAFAVCGVPKGVGSVFALTMRADLGQHGGHGFRAHLKHLVWKRLSRNFPGVLASNDPCLIERLGPNVPAELIEDFSFCHGLAPLGSPDPELRCLAIGYLDGRKNLSPLMQAALICRRNGISVRLILAGELIEAQLDEAGRSALANLRSQDAVTEWPGRIAEAQYREALSQSHVVWAVYRDHEFASGVVIDTIAAGRALLAQTSGVIGHYARRYRLAVTRTPDANANTIAEALAEIKDLILKTEIADRVVSAGTRTSLPHNRTQYVARVSRALMKL